MPVVPHGVRLSLGGAEPVDAGPRRAPGRGAPSRLGAPLVSEHIAFVRAGGVEAGHLLPLPRSREAVDAVVANVRRTQAELAVPIALEPIAALFDWPDAELAEARRSSPRSSTGPARCCCSTSPTCTPTPATAATDPLDAARPRCRWTGSRTCTWPAAPSTTASTTTPTPTRCPPAVLDLVDELCARRRPPALMLERDGHYPPAAELRAELDALAAAAGYPAVT